MTHAAVAPAAIGAAGAIGGSLSLDSALAVSPSSFASPLIGRLVESLLRRLHHGEPTAIAFTLARVGTLRHELADVCAGTVATQQLLTQFPSWGTDVKTSVMRYCCHKWLMSLARSDRSDLVGYAAPNWASLAIQYQYQYQSLSSHLA
jgi:hypothetical protein